MGPDHLYTLLTTALASFMVFRLGPNPSPIPWYNPFSHLQLNGGFEFLPSVSFTPSHSPPPSTPPISSGPVCLITEYRPLLERTPPPPPPTISPSLHNLVSGIIASLTFEDVLRGFEDCKAWSASHLNRGITILCEVLMVTNDFRTANLAEFDLGVLMCWIITIKIAMRRRSRAKGTLREPPGAHEIDLEEVDCYSSSSTSDPITPTPSSTHPLTASLSLPCLHSLAPLRPIVTLPPLPIFSATDRYGNATATPAAILTTMRLVEAPPVQSTGLAAVKRTIRPNIGSEAVVGRQEYRPTSGSAVTISTYPPIPTATATPILIQRRMLADKDIPFDDLPPSVTVNSLQDFGEPYAPAPPLKVLRLLQGLKTPTDVALSSYLPSSDHASGTEASTLPGVVETVCSSASGTTIAGESESWVSPPDLVPLGASASFPSPRAIEFPRCCDLHDPDFLLVSWRSYNYGSCWGASQSTPLFRPQDSDGGRPTIRIAVDNIVYSARSKLDTAVFRNRAIDDALESFDVKSKSCYWPRIVDGVPDRQMAYAIVDFGSVGEAERAFRVFQGRRVNVNCRHWRLEFLDPADGTFAGRRKFDLA